MFRSVVSFINQKGQLFIKGVGEPVQTLDIPTRSIHEKYTLDFKEVKTLPDQTLFPMITQSGEIIPISPDDLKKSLPNTHAHLEVKNLLNVPNSKGQFMSWMILGSSSKDKKSEIKNHIAVIDISNSNKQEIFSIKESKTIDLGCAQRIPLKNAACILNSKGVRLLFIYDSVASLYNVDLRKHELTCLKSMPINKIFFDMNKCYLIETTYHTPFERYVPFIDDFNKLDFFDLKDDGLTTTFSLIRTSIEECVALGKSGEVMYINHHSSKICTHAPRSEELEMYSASEFRSYKPCVGPEGDLYILSLKPNGFQLAHFPFRCDKEYELRKRLEIFNTQLFPSGVAGLIAEYATLLNLDTKLLDNEVNNLLKVVDRILKKIENNSDKNLIDTLEKFKITLQEQGSIKLAVEVECKSNSNFIAVLEKGALAFNKLNPPKGLSSVFSLGEDSDFKKLIGECKRVFPSKEIKPR